VDDDQEIPSAPMLKLPITTLVSNNPVNVRKHRRFGGNDGCDELQQKLMKCLDKQPDSCDSFGASVGETLKKFTGADQEFVKAQIQQVLAISLRKHEKNEEIPMFLPSN